MISLIACIGENGELGAGNDLVFHIKEDMAYFKETTMGRPIIMGRKTFESIGGKPLKGRTNYVTTRHPEDLPDTVEPVRDLRQFLDSAAASEQEYFVIGGATVYKEALPYADKLYLTEVYASVPAGVFFPDFDKSAYIRTVIKEGKDHDLTYSFVIYSK